MAADNEQMAIVMLTFFVQEKVIPVNSMLFVIYLNRKGLQIRLAVCYLEYAYSFS